MLVICEECGLTQEQEKPGRYYCVQCNKYTKSFAQKLEENE